MNEGRPRSPRRRCSSKPPRVGASPCALECQWLQTVPLYDRRWQSDTELSVLGQVVGVHIDERFIKDGLLDTAAAMRPIARAGYHDYYTVMAGDEVCHEASARRWRRKLNGFGSAKTVGWVELLRNPSLPSAAMMGFREGSTHPTGCCDGSRRPVQHCRRRERFRRYLPDPISSAARVAGRLVHRPR